MSSTVILLSGVASLFIGVVMCIIGRSNYQLRFQEKYSFFRHFPYEMHHDSQMKFNFFFRFVFALFIASFIMFQIAAFSRFAQMIHWLCMIIGVIAGLLLLTLFLISMRDIKLHVFAFSASLGTTILSYVALAYFAFTTPFEIPGKTILKVLSILLPVLLLLFSLHPKMKSWTKLEKEVQEDGTFIYKRPRFVSLAFMEWMIFFFLLFHVVLCLIFLYPR